MAGYHKSGSQAGRFGAIVEEIAAGARGADDETAEVLTEILAGGVGVAGCISAAVPGNAFCIAASEAGPTTKNSIPIGPMR